MGVLIFPFVLALFGHDEHDETSTIPHTKIDISNSIMSKQLDLQFWMPYVEQLERKVRDFKIKRKSALEKDRLPRRTYYKYKKIWNTLNNEETPVKGVTTVLEETQLSMKGAVWFSRCGCTVPSSVLGDNYAGGFAFCPNHRTRELALEDKYHKNENLLKALNSKSNAKFEFPDQVTTVLLSDYLVLQEAESSILTGDTEWESFLQSEIPFHHLDMGSSPTYTTKQQDLIKGGTFPHKDKFSYKPSQLVRNPGDGTFNVLSWQTPKGTKDSLVIGSLSLRNEDIREISERETEDIANMPRGKRHGAAGGYLIPSIDTQYDGSESCSRATKKRRVWNRSENSTSTYAKLKYQNEVSEKLYEVSIYRDPYMARNNSKQKRADMQSLPSVRRKTIAEMKSRLFALAIHCHLGLGVGRPIWDSFNQAIERAGCTWWEWKKIDFGLSSLDIVLLEWSAGTGEMKNHEAVVSHADANKSHYAESMTMFGRIPSNYPYSSASAVYEMKKGLLCFPLLGFAVEVECGRDVLHLQLANTMHLADGTRDTENWSWVHGP